MQTGTQIAGRPSFGAWLSYGLGSLNDDLPTFIAMTSGEEVSRYMTDYGVGFCLRIIRESNCDELGISAISVESTGVTRRDRLELYWMISLCSINGGEKRWEILKSKLGFHSM